jgi:hypothetical protein
MRPGLPGGLDTWGPDRYLVLCPVERWKKGTLAHTASSSGCRTRANETISCLLRLRGHPQCHPPSTVLSNRGVGVHTVEGLLLCLGTGLLCDSSVNREECSWQDWSPGTGASLCLCLVLALYWTWGPDEPDLPLALKKLVVLAEPWQCVQTAAYWWAKEARSVAPRRSWGGRVGANKHWSQLGSGLPQGWQRSVIFPSPGVGGWA